jgi:2-polyprenyl-3-methyl-5-hydroxy-6-metoxy-1,4-benzoquinol methylase
MENTRDPEYADRLSKLESKSWKRVLNVQAPYKWNLARLELGKTLDGGCGLGRNLLNRENGVGVDHNQDSVLIARSKGLTAYSTDKWESSSDAVQGSFDSILLAHVLEHLSEADADQVITSYLPYLKPGGNLVLICPQEKGFPTDPTHIRWVNDAELRKTGTRLGFIEVKNYSFPLPRFAGKLFTYNEFVYIGKSKNGG